MDGVADMITLLQVEAVFTDGSRLVSIHHPIKIISMDQLQQSTKTKSTLYPDKTGFKPDKDVIVGGVITYKDEICYNLDRQTLSIKVRNTGDRPIQVGSHFHFFEVNRYMEFDRSQAFGMKDYLSQCEHNVSGKKRGKSRGSGAGG